MRDRSKGRQRTRRLPSAVPLPAASLLLLTAAVLGLDSETRRHAKDPSPPAAAAAAAALDGGDGYQSLFPVPPPPFSPEVYPCSDCHEADPGLDTTPTDDLFHDDIDLQHDPENLWCYSCHTPQNRDQLHLSNGQPVAFTESYRLCGQCHGTQYRDWQAGDHGKRTGSWSGAKSYLLCAHCHSPHSPTIKPIAPLPPPLRQEFIK